MGIWSIYRNSGQAPNMIAVCDSLEYHGEWMGDCFLTVSVKSPTPVTFRVGDYVEYRGEKYYIDYDPNTIKKAESGTYKEGFTYDGIKLYSEFHALSDIMMKDYVLNDNGLAYSQQANFSFFASSVEDLADRIQANLDKATKGQNWKVVTPNADRSEYRNGGTDITASERRKYYGASPDGGYRDVNVVCNSIMLTDAVKMAYDLFGLSFIVTDRRIIIGGTPQPVSSSLSYGKGYGLYEVEKVTDESQRVVTKMYAYGSSDNLPLNYYANLHKQFYATVLKVDKSSTKYYYCEFTLSMSYKPSMFTEVCKWTDSSGNTYNNMGYVVKIKLGSTEITARVNNPKDSTDGLVHIYAEHVAGSEDPSDEPNEAKMSAFITSLTVGQTIYFTAGIDKNRWPTSGIDYGDSANYPALLSISNLMLPGFPDQSLFEWVALHGGTDLNESSGQATYNGHTAYFSKEKMSPWIMSVKADTLGEREGAVYFDGSSNDTENIHPTIESTGGNVVTYRSSITDNGYLADNTDLSFSIEITAAGDLDWRELYNSRQEDAYLNMKSGYCTGRAFKILSLPKKTGSSWTVKLERSKDGSLDRYFPYQDMSATYSQYAQIRKNDTFVVTGIQLPKDYVDAASKKLLEAALERLEAIDHPKQTYIPKIDELWAARDYDKKHTTSTDTSLYTNIYPGMSFSFEDADVLGAGVTMTRVIDSLTIKEDGNNGIPTFDIVLREEKEETFEQRVQSQMSSGSSGSGKSSSGQGITEDDIDSYVDGMMKVDMFSKLFEVHGKIKDGKLDVNGTDTKIGYKDWKEVFDDDDAKWKTWEQAHVQDKKPYESLLNIKAKRGLWSEFFISALGVGGSGTGTPFELNEPLNSINNMKSLPTTVGHTIVWNGSAGWGFGKAGGGDELGDVLQDIKEKSVGTEVSNLQSGMTLEYDGTKWKYGYLLRGFKISITTDGETKTFPFEIPSTASTPILDFSDIFRSYITVGEANNLFVTKAFFEKLFQVHEGSDTIDGTVIETNGDLTNKTFNIESLVGIWTKKWVSALGANGSGSGGGGVIELTGILGSLYRTTTTIGSTAGALYYNGSGDSWSFVPLNQGIDVTALQNYLDDKKYIKGDTNTKWWGQTMGSDKLVKGDIKDADDIYMNKGKFVKVNFGNNTNYDILGMSDSDNTLLVGWGIRGTSYNTTIAGGTNVNIGHGTNANDTYGKYWTVFRGNGHVTVNTSDDTNADRNIFLSVGGSARANRLYLYTHPNDPNKDIYLEYDGNGTTPGVHLVGAGLWSDSFISALGSNPTQGTGFEANRLVASLNDSTLEPKGYSGKVLVNNNGTWSWEDYGAGGGLDENAMWAALGGAIDNKKIDNSHLSLKTLTFKAGSEQNGVGYSPTGTDNTIITFDAAANSGISVARNSNTITIGNTEISGLAEGSYTKVTVDKYGRVTAGEKPTTLESYGITDAVSGATKWWGQSIQTVSDGKVVKGDMTEVGSITMDGNIKMLKDKSLDIKIGESYYSALGTWSASNLQMLYLGYYTSAQEGAGYATSIYGNTLRLFGSSTTLGMYIDNAGNVGVGKWSPSYRLDVEGTVNATEFRVGGNYITTQGSNKYLKIISAKEDIRIGTGNNNNTLHINYGGVGDNERVVTDYKWHAGNPETWASFRMGDTQVTKLYLFKPNSDDTGAVYLTYESSGAGKGVHLVGDGFWADGFVSALGSQSSGGQDYFNADMMWKELGTDSTAKLIPRSHLDLSDYALTVDVTKTLTIKNGNGDIIGTYNGTEPKEITVSGLSGDYLPLTLPAGGKTVTIPSVANNLNSVVTFKNAGSDYSLIRFEGKDAGGLGFIGIGKTGDNVHLSYVTADAYGGYTEGESQWHSILHTGNFRAGDNVSISWNATEKKYVVSSTITALDWSKITTGKPTTLAGYGIATKWWGQTYKTVNGGEVVEGDMTGVGSITMSGNIYMPYNKALIMKTSEDKSESVISLSPIDTTKTGHDNDVVLLGYETAKHGIKTRIFGGDIGFYYGTGRRHGMTLTSEGKLGIGTTAPETTLDVIGSEYVKDELKIGDERLFWSKRNENDVFMCYSWNASANSYRDILIGTFTDAIQWGGLYFNGSSWNWGVGTATPATKLDVNGSIKANRFYLRKPNSDDTGAIYFVWDNDSSNPGVHLVGAGLWSDSYISALGSKSSGGQDYFDAQRMWEELGNYDTKKIDNSHLSLYSLSFTTSAGTIEYNPTTGGQTIDLSSVSGNYLPLSLPSGGKSVEFADLNSTVTFRNTASKWVAIGFKGQDEYLGFLSVSKATNGYVTPFFVTAGSSTPYEDGVSGWYALLHAGNSSVSKSGDTLTVKINGTTQSLTNTWRGIQNKLTSTSTTESLSAYQGYLLANGSARDDTKLGKNANAASATKLSDDTAKTVWGRTFFTGGKPQTVTGALESVTDITMSGNIYMSVDKYIYTKISNSNRGLLGTWSGYTAAWLGYYTAHDSGYDMLIYGKNIKLFYDTSATQGFVLNDSGNVGIGTDSPSCKLHVSGTGYMTTGLFVGGRPTTNQMLYVAGIGRFTNSVYVKNSLTINNDEDDNAGAFIKIGNATLKWTGTALECDKDFYSKGAVSALGSNTSGGGSQIELTGLLAAMYGKDMPSGSGALYYNGSSWSFQPISGGTSGDYIPLSGSRYITGDLTPQNYDSAQNDGCDLGNDSKRWRQIWGKNFIGETVELSGNAKISGHVGIGTNPSDTHTLSVLGSGNFSGNLSAPSISTGSLTLNGTMTFAYGLKAQNIEIEYGNDHNNEINNTASTLWLQYSTSNSISLCKGGGKVYIGDIDSDNDGLNVYFEKVSVGPGADGLNIHASAIKLNGAFIHSDMRIKEIVSYIDNLTVEGIALAPIFNFRWVSNRNGLINVGTSAQYWQGALPHAVLDFGGTLSMDYGATALASAVITARKVVDHELRIKQLEQENAILRKEIEELKAA